MNGARLELGTCSAAVTRDLRGNGPWLASGAVKEVELGDFLDVGAE